MTTETAIATIESRALEQAGPSPSDMLQSIVKGGITPENVATFEKSLEICYRMEGRNAEKEFARALVKLQADCKNVKAIRPVIIGGSVRYNFAPYEDLMNEVAPHLEKNGFSVSFSTAFEGERVIKTLRLQHVGGHVKTNDYAAKISKPITNREGKETVSEAQMESMASTTAKRGALCDALNLVVEKYQHDDARLEGDNSTKVTPDQAFELERRVKELNRNALQFLQLADAKSFAEILARRYDYLNEYLQRLENKPK